MQINDIGALVTGAASGLGRATAARLAESGARVAILDRDAEGAAAAAAALGGVPVAVDVTDEASVDSAVAVALDAVGPVGILVNCAGIAPAERVLGRRGPHRMESFRQTLDVNLSGSFAVLRRVAEAMAGNEPNEDGERGVIINTASIAAFEGQKGQVAYAASKGGIAGLTLPAARDLSSLGIRVNAIAPGVFLTPMLEGLGPEVHETLAADVVFPRRLGRPSEFAALVAHIVENPYMNGSVIRLDGALRMP